MQRRQLILGLASLVVPTKVFATPVRRVGMAPELGMPFGRELQRMKDTENYWKSKPPEVREWLRSIKPPGESKLACCSEADGKPCLEDIREEVYWVTLPLECYTDEKAYAEPKMPYPKKVPEECIVRPNMVGEPVAWINYYDGLITFRCYCPGGGV